MTMSGMVSGECKSVLVKCRPIGCCGLHGESGIKASKQRTKPMKAVYMACIEAVFIACSNRTVWMIQPLEHGIPQQARQQHAISALFAVAQWRRNAALAVADKVSEHDMSGSA